MNAFGLYTIEIQYKSDKLGGQEIQMGTALLNGGLVHLRMVSAHVRLRSSHSLTWSILFSVFKYFCMSEDHSMSRFIQLLDQSDFMDPEVCNVWLDFMDHGGALSSLYYCTAYTNLIIQYRSRGC